MRSRLKNVLSALQTFTLWRCLPAAAVMLIAIFAWSLAVAAPLSSTGKFASVPGTDELTGLSSNGTDPADTEGASPPEIAIFSAPIAPPHYHDRYRFYHRYDLSDPRARLTPPSIDLD